MCSLMFHTDLNLETSLLYRTTEFSCNLTEQPHHKHRTFFFLLLGAPFSRLYIAVDFAKLFFHWPALVAKRFIMHSLSIYCTLLSLHHPQCSSLLSVCVCLSVACVRVCASQSKLCRLRQLQYLYLQGDLVVSDIRLVVSSVLLRWKHQHASVFPLLLHITHL